MTRGIEKGNTSREISAGVIVYRRTKNGPKFLLLYHGHGYWNFPKGKLNDGEKDLRAALREVSEETGIKPRDLILDRRFKVTEKFFFRRRDQGVFKIVVFFLARAKASRVEISWEHQGFGWFSYPEALKMLRYRGSKETLRRAQKHVSSG